MTGIKLGYEIGTAKIVNVSPSHMMVTGVTNKTGKTTTLESLIKRSEMKAIVFRTKVGEKSFLDGNPILPYFKDKNDWQYIQSVIEATMKEKIGRFERSVIIKLAKHGTDNSIIGFKKKVDAALETKKTLTSEASILTNLQAYLELVIPKIESIKFSHSLILSKGLNVMDLVPYSEDEVIQSLIIRSVMEHVLHKETDTIIVLPEAWKFIPQGRGNPCKQIVEEFTRMGATNRNFIWIDSQDMAGVDKAPLKQVSEWIFGYQAETNEVKHTLDQIPLPKSSKPTESEIMSLGKGMFYYSTRDGTTKVYAQPFWLSDEDAEKIALGSLNVDDIEMPKEFSQRKTSQVKEIKSFQSKSDSLVIPREEFNKIFDLAIKDITGIWENKFDSIFKSIEQLKITRLTEKNEFIPFDKESLIREILERIPKQIGGNVVYQVSPLEKLKKVHLESVKDKVINDVQQTSEDAKTLLKYLESVGRGASKNEICEKCFFIQGGTTQYNKVKAAFDELESIKVGHIDTHTKLHGDLRKRITEMLETHQGTQQEISAVYDHIIYHLLPEAAQKEIVR